MKAVAEALFTAEGTRGGSAKVAALARRSFEVAAQEPARLPFVGGLFHRNPSLARACRSGLQSSGRRCDSSRGCRHRQRRNANELGSLARALQAIFGSAACERAGGADQRDGVSPPGLSLEEAERLGQSLVEAKHTRAWRSCWLLTNALRACSERGTLVVRAVPGRCAIASSAASPSTRSRRPSGGRRRRGTAAGLVIESESLRCLAHDDRSRRRGASHWKTRRLHAGDDETRIPRADADIDVKHVIGTNDSGGRDRAQAHRSPEGCVAGRAWHRRVTGRSRTPAPLAEIRQKEHGRRTRIRPTIVTQIVVSGRRTAAPRSRRDAATVEEDRARRGARSRSPVQLLVTDILLEAGRSLLALS